MDPSLSTHLISVCAFSSQLLWSELFLPVPPLLFLQFWNIGEDQNIIRPRRDILAESVNDFKHVVNKTGKEITIYHLERNHFVLSWNGLVD
jgi:hypothetical protein